MSGLTLVLFQGYLESGLEFDSTSLAERGPLNFTLGTNTVIPGICGYYYYKIPGNIWE